MMLLRANTISSKLEVPKLFAPVKLLVTCCLWIPSRGPLPAAPPRLHLAGCAQHPAGDASQGESVMLYRAGFALTVGNKFSCEV